METLKIKNFGPIQSANIKLKTILLFIGPQSSGKSAMAKLISIVRDAGFLQEQFSFETMLNKFGIESYVNETTEISYKSSQYSFSYKAGKPSINYDGKSLKDHIQDISDVESITETAKSHLEKTKSLDITLTEIEREFAKAKNPKAKELIKEKYQNTLQETRRILEEMQGFIKVQNDFIKRSENVTTYSRFSKYIPAERNIFSILTNVKFSLSNNAVPFPETIQNLGLDIERALKNFSAFKIPFLKLEVTYDESFFIIKDLKKGEQFQLTKMASGVQSLIPLMTVIEHFSGLDLNQTFVIEEPEMNLYPETQYDVIKYLISKKTNACDMVITTHSPYCLSAINNMLFAHKTASGLENPKVVTKIMSQACWIPPKDFAAYYLQNGKAKSIVDETTGLIDENELDNASIRINDDFENLYTLGEITDENIYK